MIPPTITSCESPLEISSNAGTAEERIALIPCSPSVHLVGLPEEWPPPPVFVTFESLLASDCGRYFRRELGEPKRTGSSWEAPG
jgi:hypothetical protein